MTKKSGKTFALSLTVGAALAGGFWWTLTSTLDQMTLTDCEAGILKACESLKQNPNYRLEANASEHQFIFPGEH